MVGVQKALAALIHSRRCFRYKEIQQLLGILRKSVLVSLVGDSDLSPLNNFCTFMSLETLRAAQHILHDKSFPVLLHVFRV